MKLFMERSRYSDNEDARTGIITSKAKLTLTSFPLFLDVHKLLRGDIYIISICSDIIH